MCDTAVVVTGDRVLFAKNSDRDANEAQLLEWQPAADHPRHAEVACTWLSIPQARHTHAVLLSRPFWMWGAEMGANERGVVIGNEAVFTRSRVPRKGLTGMDLLRLALERAASADEAVQVIVTLLERYGQGGRMGHEQRGFRYHSSFIIADRSQAWVLETSARRHAVERVVGARTISNVLTIPTFAEVHSDRLKTAVARGRVRRARTQALAERASGPADLLALLRDHGEARSIPRWSPLNGAIDAPCMHGGGLVANSQTTASWVSELGLDGDHHWVTATAAPCTSLFKPVAVGDVLDLGPEPTGRYDPECLWWRHERLHRAIMTDPSRLLPLIQPERDGLEAAWLADPPRPAEAFAEGSALSSRWTARVEAAAGTDRRPWWTRRYWRARDRRAGMP